MNRSTCRDALAGADNGQQLNKGNELNKVDATTAAAAKHPVLVTDDLLLNQAIDLRPT